MAATHFSGPVVSAAGFQNGTSSFEDITAAKTLVADDNGKIFGLNAAGGAAITLPAVASSAGYRVRFVTKALFATTDWVISSAEGDNIEGCLNIAGTLTSVDAADSVTFEEGADNIGDFVDFWCDGTYWYVYGVGLTALSLSSTG